MKVPFFSRKVMREYAASIALISAFASIYFISVDIPDSQKTTYIAAITIFIALVYVMIWIKANLKRSAKLNINNSNLVIKIGDLFEEAGLKAIGFNEYFDTIADDILVSKSSLNGIYLSKLDAAEISDLDKKIKKDSRLKDRTTEVNTSRQSGKKIKYKLGSIYLHNEFILIAFTHFDTQNRAVLTLKEYIACILNFWDEVDQVYAGRSITIPLMGSGITRFKDTDVQADELLAILIWTFKISRVKFKHPAKATIVIHKSMGDKINFYELNS